jgi:hypothetical protein
MLSSEKHNKMLKSDVAMLKIPGNCNGMLSAPVGQLSNVHLAQNERGTSKINLRHVPSAKQFLEL